MFSYLRLYQLTLRLYPTAYRHEYEDEMLLLFTDMLEAAQTSTDKLRLLTTSISDICRYAPHEISAEVELSFMSSPAFIKTNMFATIACITPFFFAWLYRIHMLHDREAKPALLSLITHTQRFYTIGLPSVALVLAIMTMTWSLLRSERYWQKNRLQMLRDGWHNNLLVFTGLGLVALAIIC